jgi:xanthine dehydrogenase iron-sulfur cluster and FAD-binding subunit A
MMAIILLVFFVGVEVKLKNMCYKTMIAPTHIEELNKISKESDGYTFGASVSLAAIEETLQAAVKEHQGGSCSYRL